MAVHQGRIDLLESYVKNDPSLMHRKLSLQEIFSKSFFRDNSDGLHLAPLEGATLLHLAIEYNERAIMQWAEIDSLTKQFKFNEEGKSHLRKLCWNE